jgi:hypothetical protein
MKDSSDNRNAFMSKVVETEDGGQKQPVPSLSLSLAGACAPSPTD